MARKNMGKVKHYNRSFYTGGQRVKHVAGVVVLLIGLFLVGWLAGPAVIDFGTSTWYKLKGMGQQEQQVNSDPAANSQDQQTVDQATQPPEENSDAAAPAVDPVQNPGEGGWAFVSVTSMQSPEQAAQTAAQLAADGVRYAVLPFKDEQGFVYYNSQLTEAQAGLSSTLFDPTSAAAALKEQGIIPVAAISAFKDPTAAAANRAMAVKYQNEDFLWLDTTREKGGKPWLSPASEQAIQYIVGLIDEAKSFGFDEIWLSHVQFPPALGRDAANFGNMGGRNMSQVLADALTVFQEHADCWVECPLYEAAKGPGSATLNADPGALGIKRLVLYADETPDPEVLSTTVENARASGAQIIALLEGSEFTLQ